MIVMKQVLKIFSLAILFVAVAISASAFQPPRKLSATPQSLTFSADGGSKSVSVTAEGNGWGIVSSPDSWATATKSAAGVQIRVSKNVSTSSRTTSITLGYGENTCTVTITQKGASSSPSSGGKAMELFNVKGVKFVMVRVDGGSFMMGSNDGDSDEKPAHRETVKTFYIGRAEVTQALWEAVMGSNPSKFKGANLPVENVSWDDCKEFIKRLNRLTGKSFRLPTEAEWEYAARGGNRSEGYKYSGNNYLDRVGWYDGNSDKKTHPVATKGINELGIYDMSGNVWEWTSDKYSRDYNSPRNGGTSGAYRVYRGGSSNNIATSCRSTLRYYDAPGSRNCYLGLRLAL